MWAFEVVCSPILNLVHFAVRKGLFENEDLRLENHKTSISQYMLL